MTKERKRVPLRFPAQGEAKELTGQHQQANIACSRQKTGMHMVTETTQVFHTSPVPRSEFHEDYDWATMMAYTGMQKYAMETGKSFPVEFPKVGYEVRVHAQSYQADIFVKRSDRTDIAPNENGFFQSVIDFFYGLGAR